MYSYIWCLMVNDGFFMEPDVSLLRLFRTKKEALLYIKKNKSKHRYYFIEKKRIDIL